MTDAGASYGLWLLVFINSAVFIIFAFSFWITGSGIRGKEQWCACGSGSGNVWGFVKAIFASGGIKTWW